MAAVHSVSQVSLYLKQVLESDPLLADLLVEGEVSNLRVSAAGHSYFTLKDDSSVLNCVMFRGQSGAELLTNGNAVLAHGRIRFYEPRGSTDFMVDMAVAAGEGELALELERAEAAAGSGRVVRTDPQASSAAVPTGSRCCYFTLRIGLP